MSWTDVVSIATVAFLAGAYAGVECLEWATRKGWTIYQHKTPDPEAIAALRQKLKEKIFESNAQ